MEGLIASLALLVPFGVTLITELGKRVPFIPVESKNAKFVAFGFSVVAVLGMAYLNKTLVFDKATLYAGEIVATYVASVGIYETVKNLINKI